MYILRGVQVCIAVPFRMVENGTFCEDYALGFGFVSLFLGLDHVLF